LAARPENLMGANDKNIEPAWTVEDFARRVAVPVSWVYTNIQQLPAFKVGRYWRFRPDRAEAWIREREQQPGKASR
jgi:hypothetical protein